jgi:hypothetical protein
VSFRHTHVSHYTILVENPSYLEQGGQNTVVRPWVWIICLAAGPIIGRLAFQWYIYITVRVMLLRDSLRVI